MHQSMIVWLMDQQKNCQSAEILVINVHFEFHDIYVKFFRNYFFPVSINDAIQHCDLNFVNCILFF